MIGDGDPQALAVCVLERLRSDSIDKLLSIQPKHQQLIERFLRRVALERLGKEPMRERAVYEVRGHPIHLAELAYERQGDVGVAAALYALNHDLMLPFRNDQLEDDLREVRLAFARALFAFDVKRQPWTLELVERMRPRFEQAGHTATVNVDAMAEVDAWLSTHRTRLALSRSETKTVDDVVVDEADGLHEGVTDRRSDE